jgi:hypothetical protein
LRLDWKDNTTTVGPYPMSLKLKPNAQAGRSSDAFFSHYRLDFMFAAVDLSTLHDYPCNQIKSIDMPTQFAPIVGIGARTALGVAIFSSLGLELRVDGAYVAHRPEFDIYGKTVWLVAPFTGALRLAIVGELNIQRGP